jgi:hypothetical protein
MRKNLEVRMIDVGESDDTNVDHVLLVKLILVDESRERVDSGPGLCDDVGHDLDIDGGALQYIVVLDEVDEPALDLEACQATSKTITCLIYFSDNILVWRAVEDSDFLLHDLVSAGDPNLFWLEERILDHDFQNFIPGTLLGRDFGESLHRSGDGDFKLII